MKTGKTKNIGQWPGLFQEKLMQVWMIRKALKKTSGRIHGGIKVHPGPPTGSYVTRAVHKRPGGNNRRDKKRKCDGGLFPLGLEKTSFSDPSKTRDYWEKIKGDRRDTAPPGCFLRDRHHNT